MGESWVEVGAKTDKVDDEIVGAFSKAGKKGAEALDDELDKGAKASGGKLKSAGSSLASTFAGAFGGALTAQGLISNVKGIIDAAADSAKVAKQLDIAFENNANSAGLSRSAIDKLVDSLSKKAGMDDEAIASGEALLLQFKDVRNEAGAGNDIFDRTSALMVDMAAKMGVDASSAAKMLGKALNEPGLGLSRLRAQGIEFTKEQEKQITAMNDAGDAAGAQKLILDALEGTFKGAAEAQATNADRMHVAWENVQEQLGSKILPMFEKVMLVIVGTVIPAISNAIEQIGPIIQNVITFVTPFVQGVMAAINQTKAIFDEFGFSVQGFSFAIDELLGRILRGFGVSAETAAIWQERIRNVFLEVVNVVRTAIDVVSNIIETVMDGIRAFWRTWGDDVMRIVESTFEFIRSTVQAVITIVQGIIQTVMALIHGDWGEAWDGILKILTGVWDAIKAVITNAGQLISIAIDMLMKAISGILDEGWQLIKDHWTDALKGLLELIKLWAIDLPKIVAGLMLRAGEALVEAMMGGLNTLWSNLDGWLGDLVAWLGTLPGKLWSAALFIGTEAVRGIRWGLGEMWTQLEDWFQSLVGTLLGLPGRLWGIVVGIGQSVVEGIIAGIGDVGGAVWGAISGGISSLASKIKSTVTFGLLAGGGNIIPQFALGGNALIPHYAGGTQRASGGLAIVGELGPELVQFGGNAAVFPTNQFEEMMSRAMQNVGGGQSVTLNVSIGSVQGDPYSGGQRFGMGLISTLAARGFAVQGG